MCIFKDAKHFIKNGLSTFYNASKGCYGYSETIMEIKKEILNYGNKADDKRKLIEDRKNVSKDIRKVFNQIA
jgi:hypothetical protein